MLEQLAPGVYGYVQADGSWFINNTGLITGPETVICIDSCATEQRTQQYLEAIRTVTGDPINVLVNTHHHPDHTNGNGLLGASAIIAQTRCRAELAESIATPPPGLFEPVDWGELDPRLPTVCFESRIELHAGSRRIELLHFGTPAHTTNDIVAWLPTERILFAGDLAWSSGTPFALSGSIAGWLEVLEQLNRLDPEIVIPGHGEVGGPELLAHTAAYLRFVRDAAPAAHAAGLTPLEAAGAIDLGPYAELSDSERIVGNLQRAFAELDGLNRGAPLDHPAAFMAMVNFNSGRPLRCLA